MALIHQLSILVLLSSLPAVAGPKAMSTGEIEGALDRFYRAGEIQAWVRELDVSGAEEVPPEIHEILGSDSLLRGEEEEAFEHFLAALHSPSAKIPLYYIYRLVDLVRFYDQQVVLARSLKAFSEEAQDHSAAVAAAAGSAARLLMDIGDFAASRELLARLGFLSEWQLLSGFENDRGQGFSTMYGPERDGVLPEGTYRGQKRPIAWRRVDQVDSDGMVLIHHYETPAEWSIGYLATWVRAPASGLIQLRVTSSTPIKVWWNGQLVASVRTLRSARLDQITVEVQIQEEWNQLLLKSCQDTGPWKVGARITDLDGHLVEGLEATADVQRSPVTSGGGVKWTVDDAIPDSLRHIEPRARRAFVRAYLLQRNGFGKDAAAQLDQFLEDIPGSPLASLERARNAATEEEAERMHDLLGRAIAKTEGLHAFRLFWAKHFIEQDRLDRALAEIDQVLGRNPDHFLGRKALADLYIKKEWYAEACILYEALQLQKVDPDVMYELARCAERNSRNEEWRELLGKILALWPGHRNARRNLQMDLLRQGKIEASLSLLDGFDEYDPLQGWVRLWRADVFRRQRRWDESIAEYRAVAATDPGLSRPHVRIGLVQLERGRSDEARKAWRKALELNPADYNLWERFSRVFPEEDSLLQDQMIDDQQIERLLEDAAIATPEPESAWVTLLDQEVTRINKDGSVRRGITKVVRVQDEIGQEEWSSVDFPTNGRVRLLRAQSIGPGGSRAELSSFRKGQARFQGVRPGTVLVFQYLYTTFAETQFNNHWARRWFFSSNLGYTRRSEFSLILPDSIHLNVFRRGPIEASIRDEDGYRIYSWVASDLPPTRMQTISPPPVDLVPTVLVSTVPDWDFLVEWTRSLMEEAGILTPAIQQAVAALRSEDDRVGDLLLKAYRFVTEEIRYEKDYEAKIMGVRPHSAGVVLERGYGDCKDKSILLIALLEALGIDARYAILSTSDHGKLNLEVPMSQFNHAIVFIPEQPGVPQGLFLDPTARFLDYPCLPKADQGRTALVVEDEGFSFLTVPFSRAGEQWVLFQIHASDMGANGEARVQMELLVRGPLAAMLRGAGSNSAQLTQAMQGFLCGSFYPGAKLESLEFVEGRDILRPVHLRAVLRVPGFFRKEGETLRVPLRFPFSPAGENAKWKTRRQPLFFGPPSMTSVVLTIEAPSGYRFDDRLKSVRIEHPDIQFSLETEECGETLCTLSYSLSRATPEVPCERYPSLRMGLIQATEFLNSEVILTR